MLGHTFASRLLEKRESLAYVKEQLGHSSIKIKETPTDTDPEANTAAGGGVKMAETTARVYYRQG
jgi:integrase